MSLLSNWQAVFPDCEPVAHRLGSFFPDRWVRFHSLPKMKRYPENDAEYAEALYRHNCILEELTGPDRTVVLLTTGYSESPEPVRPETELSALDPDAVPWRTVPMHELGEGYDFPSYWHVFASVWEWRVGKFDPLVRLVADDLVWNVMIVNPDCRWLLHPYDGGMDVIAESSAARDSLKMSHAGWLSPRADGL
jgi:hypothetical protein